MLCVSSLATPLKWGHRLPCDYGALTMIRRRIKRASITASDDTRELLYTARIAISSVDLAQIARQLV